MDGVAQMSPQARLTYTVAVVTLTDLDTQKISRTAANEIEAILLKYQVIQDQILDQVGLGKLC